MEKAAVIDLRVRSSCLREDDCARMGKLTIRLGACVLIFFLSAAIASAKTIAFLGDSLTAGYGVGKERAYPALIAQKIRAANLPFDVINAGVSGDTSADGLHRIDWLLQ